MWGELWSSFTGFFQWLLARRDAREDKDRSDFQMVTTGYDKLTSLLQARVEGLVKEIDELKEKADQREEEYAQDRRVRDADMERVRRMLRQCRTREQISSLRMEQLGNELDQTKAELKEARQEIEKLKKRMDEHDSGEMKGLPPV